MEAKRSLFGCIYTVRSVQTGMLLLDGKQHVSSHTIGSGHRRCLSSTVHMATPLCDLEPLPSPGVPPRVELITDELNNFCRSMLIFLVPLKA